ncbi:YutD family protein [Paenibacillus pinihumi]|uniref:YutD family protein n=1 Tax=Paenibacillus pinihumi TaxID=669462 RepID=UPI00040BA7AF|nr:YutD family protein [Paenibacillus pinihumi]
MIQVGGRSYELLYEHKNAWNPEAFRDRYSEVLERYDYIVGDWGYSQLRLKGFFKDGHPKANKDSVYSSITDYINEYCNFGCAYFMLQKLAAPKKLLDDTKDKQSAKEAGREPKDGLSDEQHEPDDIALQQESAESSGEVRIESVIEEVPAATAKVQAAAAAPKEAKETREAHPREFRTKEPKGAAGKAAPGDKESGKEQRREPRHAPRDHARPKYKDRSKAQQESAAAKEAVKTGEPS